MEFQLMPMAIIKYNIISVKIYVISLKKMLLLIGFFVKVSFKTFKVLKFGIPFVT